MLIFVIGGISQSLVNFRGPLIRAMLDQGHEVIACAGEPLPEVATTLKEWGAHFIPVPLARAGMNPLGDLRTFLALLRLMRKHKPDAALAYTIKPVIWGALAARTMGIKNVFGMIEGLGRTFMPIESLSHWISSIVAKSLYRIALPFCTKTFFLNPDDLNQFINQKYVFARKTVQLNGTGIDLEHWCPSEPPQKQPFVFLMIARLLKDKGVREYITAAHLLRNMTPVQFKCILLGDLDENPSAISEQEVKQWTMEGVIDYRGYTDDIRSFLQACSVYVLPSYREGTPRTVLEAMATGRAIITTDAPGCRETVRRGELAVGGGISQRPTLSSLGANGILIPPRNAHALAEAMRFLLENPEQIAIMGRESRRYAEERYDVHKVNATILKEMNLCPTASHP